MDVRKLNHAEAYFLARLLDAPLARLGHVLAPQLQPVMGPEWLASIQHQGAAFRTAREAAIHTQAVSASVSLDHLKLADRVVSWRRYMEGVAAMAPGPDAQASLLKAAGRGLGAARNPIPLQAFLNHVAPAVEANAATFRHLGATEAGLAFPSQALVELAALRTRVNHARAAATKARQTARATFKTLTGTFKLVSLGAAAARSAAKFSQDAAAVAKVEELHSHLDAAVDQARGSRFSKTPRKRKVKATPGATPPTTPTG